MRWLINYIRSCFCKHEWECLMENGATYMSEGDKMPYQRYWLYRCKKCGMKNKVTL